MQLPYIADIKRGSLDDGPGIRTTVFFKGCPLSCVWCHNPECIGAKQEIVHRGSDCIDCRDCAEACQLGAIGPAGPAELDRARCQLQTDCVAACPSGALEIVGARHGVDELVTLLLRDRSFYQSSGGGVTLSGGEATMFNEYAGAVARQLRAAGVDVLLETCGHFDWDSFEAQLLPHLDHVYFDLKLIDPELHRRHCGRDNRRIVDNLERLASTLPDTIELLVRMPLVPTITCTRANLEAAAALLTDLGIRRLALLPYNPLWGPKARALGRTPQPLPERWLTPKEQDLARDCFRAFAVEGLAPVASAAVG